MSTSIIEQPNLTQQDLLTLFTGEILALRIYPFQRVTTCQKWQQDLKSKGTLSRYSNATDVPVNRIGMTLFETENKTEKISQYLKDAANTRPVLRKIFGNINPLERIIRGLKQSWSLGCNIQQYNQEPMNPGIIRSFEASNNGGLPPHVDSLLKDLPHSEAFGDLQCQLAANLYFEVAQKGGELELWDYEPQLDELATLYTGSYDFIDTNKIPVAPEKIEPRCGELILFRSSCIHSVKSSEGGIRSAASCFIGFYGEKKPLTIWA